jgi:hypothetical protein
MSPATPTPTLTHTMPAFDVIKQLRAVINNRPPVATGVLPVPRDACSLFYKHGSDVRYALAP